MFFGKSRTLKALLLTSLIHVCYCTAAAEPVHKHSMSVNQLKQKVERNCQCRVISMQQENKKTIVLRLLLNDGKVVVKKLDSVTGEPLPLNNVQQQAEH